MKMNNPIDDDPQWTAWLLGELEDQEQEKWRRMVAEEPHAPELAEAQQRWMNQFAQMLCMPRHLTLHESQRQAIRLAALAQGRVHADRLLTTPSHEAGNVFSPRGLWQRWIMVGMAAVFVLGIGLLWRELRRGVEVDRGAAMAVQLSDASVVGDFAPAAQSQSATLAPLRSAPTSAIVPQPRGAGESSWQLLPACVTPPWQTSDGAWRELEEKIVAESAAVALPEMVPTLEHAAALLNDFVFARVAPQEPIGSVAAKDQKSESWQGLRVRIERMRGEGTSQWLALGLSNGGDRPVAVQSELVLNDRAAAPTWRWRGCGWPEADARDGASDPAGLGHAGSSILSLQPQQQATLLIELRGEKKDAAALSDPADIVSPELLLRVGAEQRRWSLTHVANFLQIADFADSSIEMQHLVLVWRFAEWLHHGAKTSDASSWVSDCLDMQSRDDNGERRRARSVMLRAWQRVQEK